MSEIDIDQTVDFLLKKGIKNPDFAVVLGTGLGKLIDHIKIEISIAYHEIPNFQEATVEFHEGRLVYGELCGKKILAMQGRYHFYEGYTMQQITFPVRVMKKLGVAGLLLSNAAGALNHQFKKAEMMLITDHINLQPANPLLGKNLESFGPRFPDMGKPYSPKFNQLLVNCAKELKITLHQGNYVSVPGPNLETKAEYRYLKIIGADAVGMSTVPEVIVANHSGLPCCAISVLTDECNPDDLKPVDIKDIIANAMKAEEHLIQLVLAFFKKLKL